MIPLEKIHDVLLNPEAYAEMYPEIFPLTRKVHRQLRALGASGLPGGVTETPVIAGDYSKSDPQNKRSSRGLETTTQEPFVSTSTSPHPTERSIERQPPSFLDMTDDDDFEIASGHSGPGHTIHQIWHAPAGKERNVLDLVERGEWEVVPQVSVAWAVNMGNSGYAQNDDRAGFWPHART